jgi:hypothetical protein
VVPAHHIGDDVPTQRMRVTVCCKQGVDHSCTSTECLHIRRGLGDLVLDSTGQHMPLLGRLSSRRKPRRL